jgi:pyruvate/2-oxoglutarate dehydrogenase complex dihydrolipoamide dehydrogenase (E3) component
MTEEGVKFMLSVTEYVSIDLLEQKADSGHPAMQMKLKQVVDGEVVDTVLICDAVLVATGRRPNVTGMDLEKAGIEYDVEAGIKVNDRLQTSNSGIYSAGDCASQFKFTHAADFMARAVVKNALFLGKERMSKLLIPYATFTDPEIASVGLYESDLRDRGIEFRVFEKYFKDNDRAICDSCEVGFVRVRVEPKTDKILGCSIVGAGAANMISEVTLAMQSGTGMQSLASVIHPYPTTAESVRQTGDLYNKSRLTPTVKKILRGALNVQFGLGK